MKLLRQAIFVVLFLPALVCAQADSARVTHDTTIVVQPGTTAPVKPAPPPDTTVAFHMKKSPWLAVGLSAALPGAGQIYNHDYWKVPIIWGIEGYWVSVWISLNNNYHHYEDLYNQVKETDPTSNYKNSRDFYRDERDRFAWYMGALYLLNLVDAYVGANLYDFDVSPNLGPGNTSAWRATVRVKF